MVDDDDDENFIRLSMLTTEFLPFEQFMGEYWKLNDDDDEMRGVL